MRTRVVVALTMFVTACTPRTGEEKFGPECQAVRARAATASLAANELRRQRGGTPLAAAEASALLEGAGSYVTAIESRPECFSAGQRADAARVKAQIGQQK